MISKETNSECFVYITLPRQTESVTCGRLVLETGTRGSILARFVYGKKYLAHPNAVEIDPVELKLVENVYRTAYNGGVFGALRDSAPDYWGRLLIDKHAGKVGLSELDYLLESPDDRVGALSFGLGQKPPAPKRKFNQAIELELLQQIAEAIIREEVDRSDHLAVQVQELMLLGTSMGGARPKAVVEDDAGLWIAKFSRPDDRWNNPRVEYAMLELARKCGISAARSRIETVGSKDVILIQRFDREKTSKGYCRARMISALTLLRAQESVRDRWSYVLLAEELRRVSAEPKKDSAELFRRMCFNALISNLDDHPRNHAFFAMDKDWKLSPAYDLTPFPVVSQSHRDLAMVCGDLGRLASSKNFLTQSSRFLLSDDEAKNIIIKMSRLVSSNWYKVARSAGVTEKDTETIKGAFVYEGFGG
jgi:serine/threonine-protein kinase HipA